jgi:hypothetical protein
VALKVGEGKNRFRIFQNGHNRRSRTYLLVVVPRRAVCGSAGDARERCSQRVEDSAAPSSE